MRNPVLWLIAVAALAFLAGTAAQLPAVHAPRLAAAMEAR